MPSHLKVDRDIKSKVDAFRERITREAEDLVSNVFPRKLLELDNFLKNPCINISDLSEIHSEISPTAAPDELEEVHNAGKRKLLADDKGGDVTGGVMKSNAKLVDLIEKVKPEIRTLIEKCNTVKMWVQLLIPKIEDGNNFGVSIQEETVAELGVVRLEAESYLGQISKYYVTRANQMSKIVKYPQVEDYLRTVTEIDEKIYISLKIIVSEIRNYYITLHDMILKNIEKIKKPRSSNTDSLY